MSVISRRSVDLTLYMNRNTQKCSLKDVLFVPDLQYSLISTGVLVSKNFDATFNSSSAKLRKDGKKIAVASRQSNLFSLQSVRSLQNVQTACIADFKKWHAGLGHTFSYRILDISNLAAVYGLIVSDTTVPKEFQSCITGKMQHVMISNGGNEKPCDV